ncbi:hypothetical protein [Streptomyces sp. NPDC006193]|uniref:hypothetical protein n=1 Tax=Streptomyces sp. NPDC006193 TaxID=3155717 RepID=UPI0033B926C6
MPLLAARTCCGGGTAVTAQGRPRWAVALAKKGRWAPDPHPGPGTGDPAVLGPVALHGREALPPGHALAPAPGPEYVMDDPPGLGGGL